MSTPSLDARATMDIVGAAAPAVEDAGEVLDGRITNPLDDAKITATPGS